MRNMSNASLTAFFYLLRGGLWEKRTDLPGCFPLSDGQWEEVYRLARQQTVRGLVFRGICMLPESVLPAEAVLARWTACADAIERRSNQMNRALTDLCRWFAEGGLHPVVLKGQGMARLYVHPLLRECGDIDLYFPQPTERRQAEQMLQQAGIRMEVQADGSTHYAWQGVPVEHHSSAYDLQGGAVCRFLQQMEQHHGFHEISLLPGQGHSAICIPAPGLNFVLLNAHILKHTLGRGIGLRQLCDLARCLARLSFTADRKELSKVCSLAGISRWTYLLQSFMVEYLGLPERQLPVDHKLVDTRPLLERILRGGNFGQHRPGADRPVGRCARKIRTAASFLQNIGFALRYAPREALYIFMHLSKGQLK